MTKYTAIIVDDETHALGTLTTYIKNVPNLNLVGSYENPLEALALLSTSKAPDVAFLDIDMPELSGLALANLTHGRVKIIFTSAHQQYALEAIGLHAAGYLLKPFSFEDFLKTLTHVLGTIVPRVSAYLRKPIFFSTGVKGKFIKIMSDEIIYIEAMLNYVKIYSRGDERPKIIYHSLKSARTRLENTELIQVSRSFVINTIFLEKIEGNKLTLSNGKIIQLGPTFKAAFHAFLHNNIRPDDPTAD